VIRQNARISSKDAVDRVEEISRISVSRGVPEEREPGWISF
jgi:hypothetical protein